MRTDAATLHAQTHTRGYADSHTNTNTHTYTHKHTHTQLRTQSYTQPRTLPHSFAHATRFTHACDHIHTHASIHACNHIHTCPQPYSHINTHASIHANGCHAGDSVVTRFAFALWRSREKIEEDEEGEWNGRGKLNVKGRFDVAAPPLISPPISPL